MNGLLAWVPFLKPIPSIDAWWPLLLVPLALGTASPWRTTTRPRSS